VPAPVYRRLASGGHGPDEAICAFRRGRFEHYNVRSVKHRCRVQRSGVPAVGCRLIACLFIAAICLVLPSGITRADIVHLTNGGKLEGEVTEQGDRITIKTKFGSVSVPGDEVARIEQVTTPEEEYREKASGPAPGDAEGRYQLALWCAEHGLSEEAETEARAAIAADPDHEGARKLLGYVRFEGRWVDRAERDEALARRARAALDEALKAIRDALASSSNPETAGRAKLVEELRSSVTLQVALNAREVIGLLPADRRDIREDALLPATLSELVSLAHTVSLDGLKDLSHLGEARTLVADYFLAGSAVQEAEALAALRALTDVSVEVVAAIAQTGPFYRQQPTGEQVLPIALDGVQSDYALVVPADYDPQRPYPLLVGLHGQGETGKKFVPRWVIPAMAHGYLFACPTDPQGERGYGAGAGEREVVLATIEDVARRYHVDPDRVLLTGLSAGGHQTWDVGLHYADRFAGLVPEAGMPVHEGSPITRFMYLQNLVRGPAVFVLVGEKDTGIRRVCEEAVARLQALEVEARITVVAGVGHAYYPSEDSRVFAWMAERRRDPAPPQVFDRFHHLQQGRAYWLEATGLSGPEWDATRPVRLRGLYDPGISKERVLELSRAQLVRELPWMRGRVEGNTITVGASGVSTLTVWLSPALIDFSEPVRIVLGTTAVFEGAVEPDVGILLGEMKRTWDLGRVYPAAIDVDLVRRIARPRRGEQQ